MKTRTFKIIATLFIIFSFVLSAGALSAQQLTSVTGTLVNDQAKPMDYATVSLLNVKDSAIVKGALSNDAGIYRLDHIKPGKYLIKATSIGYLKTVSLPFTIVADAGQFTVPMLKMQAGGHNCRQ